MYNHESDKQPREMLTLLNGKAVERTYYSYDKYGNRAFIDNYVINSEGEQVQNNSYVGGFPCTPCEYSVDSRGNWIKSYIILNNKRLLYATRRIKYLR
jgi:hypothetical protein